MAYHQAQAVVLMGVAGSGKTAVGMRVAEKLNWLFLDADNFHPAANIEKMKHGIPLSDQDRVPWLERLRDELQRQVTSGHSVILACSALKESYRRILRDETLPPLFVYLDVDAATIRERLSHRPAHFFPKELMDSQFATLEKPKDAIVIDARKPIDSVVDEIVHAIAQK
ncbi:MAG TPA: gluconokinase [Chthoniobacterales bacterium]|jgi:carbohydrate kinase (thermoresistant glucokinase family)|nr:gluconokinase [Chthoniobacterales bacterium]